LCGDLNPLHIDPEVAARAGFERPILHGLATYGMAAVAVMQALGIDDPSRLRGFDARFSAPVLPGDTLEFKIWATPEGAQFECICPAREVRVLSHGMARLAQE
jgi:acyl dehydratase